jgi:diguanylate cyclase (GGDEF)-like protein
MTTWADDARLPKLVGAEAAAPFETQAPLATRAVTRLDNRTVDLLLEVTRSLLWIETRADAREAAARFVTGVGGTFVDAAEGDAASLPVDLSFGLGDPVLPSAPLGSIERRVLERHLPGLVADIDRVIALSSRADRRLEDASVDALTGLPNRHSLGGALGRMRAGDVLILLDLDHLKEVNADHGHAVGDGVLRALGATLRSSVCNPDVVGRYGGEEFLIILARSDPEAFMRRLRLRWMEDRPHPVTFSAGLAPYTHAFPTAAVITDAADRAMGRAKEAGHDQWRWAMASEFAR